MYKCLANRIIIRVGCKWIRPLIEIKYYPPKSNETSKLTSATTFLGSYMTSPNRNLHKTLRKTLHGPVSSFNRTIPILFLHPIIAMELDNQEIVQQSFFTEHVQQNQKEFSPKELVQEIVERIGYEFKDATLLRQAFTHDSMNRNEDKERCATYERLEYVGDAFLSFMIAKDHFFMYPEMNPGNLTKLRSANVDTEKLARIAVKLELYKLLNHKIDGFAEKVKA